MNKFIKGCIIAGLVFILAGGGMAATSLAMGGNLTDALPLELKQWWNDVGDLAEDEFWSDSGFPFDREDNELYNSGSLLFGAEEIDISQQGEQIYSASGIKKLDADITAGTVRIVEDSGNDEITIFCNKDDSYYKIDDKEGELKFKTYPGNGYSHYSNLLFTIHVPKNHQFTKVNIDIDPSKRVKGADGKGVGFTAGTILADELSLDVKAGAANVSQASVGTLNLESEAGAINYSGNVLNRVLLNCEASAVNLELEGKKEDFNYRVKSTLGVVKLGEESVSVLGNTGSENKDASKSMELDCDVSAVKITFMNQV